MTNELTTWINERIERLNDYKLNTIIKHLKLSRTEVNKQD